MSQRVLRVAQLGLGAWGSRLHAALLQLPEYEVVALCDSQPDALARAPGTSARYSSLTQLLAESDAEALLVAAPPQAQARLGLQALESGRHLFIEKPMALSSLEAAQLVTAAQARERVVCVGHVARYQPLWEEAARLLERGAIGQVRRILVERTGARPRPGVTPWWVLGPHDLSFLLATFPGDYSFSAVAWGSEGVTHATMNLAGGVEAALRFRGPGEARRAILLLGDGGSLLLDEAASTLQHYHSVLALPALAEASPLGTLAERVDGAFAQARAALAELSAESRRLEGTPLQAELRAFHAAIVQGAALLTDARDGYRVVQALEAAERVGRLEVSGGSPV